MLWEEHSNTSHTGGGQHREPELNRNKAERQNRGNHAQNLDSSFLSVDERGNIVPKTPEAALVAAQAYLLTTQLAPRDPRESMHQVAIKGLGLIGDKLQQEISRQDRLPHSPQQGEKKAKVPISALSTATS
jgi:hypothetical protein